MVKLAVVFWVFCAGLVAAQSAEEGIFVTGEGRVNAAPDMATITLGVRQTAASPKEVMGLVSREVAAILGQLDTLGIAAQDRQTSGFYLQPIQNNRGQLSDEQAPKIIGYDAGNTVTLRIRDLDRLEEVLSAVIQEGANDFNGLRFGLQASAKAEAQARERAVRDAQDRADQLARAAGISLGDVLRISEGSQQAGPMMGRMAAEASMMSGAIAQGDVEITVQVSMVFAIRPAVE